MSATTGKGRWLPPDDGAEWATLASVKIYGFLADEILRAFRQHGLLVSSSYYAPSVGEIYKLYSDINYSYHHLSFRWVMCRETFEYLVKNYADKRYAQLLPFSWDDNGDMVVSSESHYTVEEYPVPARLLDVPIRIDPAARTVMIELVA